ncbi:MAG: YkgJ family cysteine cluster protein, partial [Myxococcota bacterium]
MTDPLDALRALHDEIDREAARLSSRHAERLQCARGCSACCLDELTVRPVEAERIRAAHPDLLRSAAPGPEGGCAFLDEAGGCRVYAERPSVCRSQGLPLRVLFENEAGDIEEARDICAINEDAAEPLAELEDDACWLIGPFELRLEAIDEAFAGAEAPR